MLEIPHIDLVQVVQAVGYPGIFFAIFAESGLFIGIFFPGASLLFTSGLLASQGLFHPVILIVGVTVAAILGDSVGYWFGRKVGYKLFLRPNSRFFKHEHLQQAEIFYEKYGSRTILLARFIPIVRTFAPIIAGIASMSYRVFLIYNILGAVIWAGGITALGYFLGTRVPGVEKYLSLIVIGIIVVSSIPLAIEAWKNRER
jgi:membrane-associated protein